MECCWRRRFLRRFQRHTVSSSGALTSADTQNMWPNRVGYGGTQDLYKRLRREGKGGGGLMGGGVKYNNDKKRFNEIPIKNKPHFPLHPVYFLLFPYGDGVRCTSIHEEWVYFFQVTSCEGFARPSWFTRFYACLFLKAIIWVLAEISSRQRMGFQFICDKFSAAAEESHGR